jgi:hypothetical protein
LEKTGREGVAIDLMTYEIEAVYDPKLTASDLKIVSNVDDDQEWRQGHPINRRLSVRQHVGCGDSDPFLGNSNAGARDPTLHVEAEPTDVFKS